MVEHHRQQLQGALQLAVGDRDAGEVAQGGQHFAGLTAVLGDAQTLEEVIARLVQVVAAQGQGAEVVVADVEQAQIVDTAFSI